MSKEIKFRAWDKKGKRMVTQGVEYYAICIDLGHAGPPEEGHLGLGTSKEERDRFDLMQYTGLKDKNGKEIYEGDILKWTSFWKCDCGRKYNKFKSVGYVQLWGGSFCVSEHELGAEHSEPQHLNEWAISRDVEYNNYYPQNSYLMEDVEIIGNIYETPELLTSPTPSNEK